MASGMSYEKVVKEIENINLGKYKHQVMRDIEKLYISTEDIDTVREYVAAIKEAVRNGILKEFIESGENENLGRFLAFYSPKEWGPTDLEFGEVYAKVFKAYGSEGTEALRHYLGKAIQTYIKYKEEGKSFNPEGVIYIFKSGVEEGKPLEEVKAKAAEYIPSDINLSKILRKAVEALNKSKERLEEEENEEQ